MKYIERRRFYIYLDTYHVFRKDRLFYNLYDLLWDENPLKLDRNKDFNDEYELIVIDILNKKFCSAEDLKNFIERRFRYWCGDVSNLILDNFIFKSCKILKIKKEA